MRLPPPEEADGLNMTPIIDVVFNLLIFFLVASRFGQEERDIGTRLAEVAKANPIAMQQEVVVNINEQGQYTVSGQKMGEEGLAGMIAGLGKDDKYARPVQIRADERVPFRFPARVMGLCERQKLKHYCTVVQSGPD